MLRSCNFFYSFLQVSAVNAVFIVLVSMAMLNNMVQKFMNYLMIVWSSIVVLVFMIYQLQVVKEDILQYNCTQTVHNKVSVRSEFLFLFILMCQEPYNKQIFQDFVYISIAFFENLLQPMLISFFTVSYTVPKDLLWSSPSLTFINCKRRVEFVFNTSSIAIQHLRLELSSIFLKFLAGEI